MLHVMHTVWVQDGSSKLVFMKYQSAYANTSVFACVHKHDDCDLPPVQMYNGKQVAFQHACLWSYCSNQVGIKAIQEAKRQMNNAEQSTGRRTQAIT